MIAFKAIEPLKPHMKFVKTYYRWWRYKQFYTDATLPAHELDCPECGQRVSVPRLQQGEEAHCPTCGCDLVQVENNPYIAPLAFASAALILMAFAYTMMYITVTMPGVYSMLTLPEMMQNLVKQDFGFLASVMFVLTFGTPFIFSYTMRVCLYRIDPKYSLPWFALCLTHIGEAEKLDHGGCFLYFHTCGLYQIGLSSRSIFWPRLLADACAGSNADSHFCFHSRTLGLLQNSYNDGAKRYSNGF